MLKYAVSTPQWDDGLEDVVEAIVRVDRSDGHLRELQHGGGDIAHPNTDLAKLNVRLIMFAAVLRCFLSAYILGSPRLFPSRFWVRKFGTRYLYFH